MNEHDPTSIYEITNPTQPYVTFNSYGELFLLRSHSDESPTLLEKYNLEPDETGEYLIVSYHVGYPHRKPQYSFLYDHLRDAYGNRVIIPIKAKEFYSLQRERPQLSYLNALIIIIAIGALGICSYFDIQPPSPQASAYNPTPNQHFSTTIESPLIPEVENINGIGNIFPPGVPFWITGDTHGLSYGHNAIDIAAEHGTQLLAPITGTVTKINGLNNRDGYGNTIIVIENDRYIFTLYHADPDPLLSVGDLVNQGYSNIATQANRGYTTSIDGTRCISEEPNEHGRYCGSHAHINFYDKQTGQNVTNLKEIYESFR